jgi:uncharacterized membrane protein YphA (DoxX/SURF4 family)
MTSKKKAKWIKTARWIYWTVTLLFVVTMMSAGLTYLAGAPFNVEGITHLGYPAYLLKILGTAKFLGGIAILQGRFRTLKEWAYAGYTFNLLGASASHALYGDPFVKVLVPIIILGFVLASYRQLEDWLGVSKGE